ncbi:MurR/RpiR family transcriptional regulator [Rhodanobacter terrae]|uniref:MurR/RpiR family transcriptional regulator n=1 Tax=Rhodanobacter terrae TaxID=418647 RepID=A0ABW0SSC7_9GAMM
MTKDLQKKLKSRWESFTAAEQKIATHLLHNVSGIPFETAASLGKRVGVSPMTVGRFLRNLGYAGLNELKEELRGDEPWLQLYATPEHTHSDPVSETLKAEIRDLTKVHALTRTAEWKAIVKLLVAADRISVASFHQARFLGIGFAGLLQSVKPRTVFVEGLDGAYADMLLDATEKSCVVLIDFRRYSRHFRILAEETAARGIPLAIVTDSQCYWARQFTDNVLMMPVDLGRAWHDFTATTSLLSLLIAAVSREQGDMFERIGDITQLRQKLVGYVEAPPDARRTSGGATKSKTDGKGKGGVAAHKSRGRPRV